MLESRAKRTREIAARAKNKKFLTAAAVLCHSRLGRPKKTASHGCAASRPAALRHGRLIVKIPWPRLFYYDREIARPAEKKPRLTVLRWLVVGGVGGWWLAVMREKQIPRFAREKDACSRERKKNLHHSRTE